MLIKPYGEIVFSPYEMNHVESEMAELISRIGLLEGEVRVATEATGAYHFPVSHRLKGAGLFVSVINPLVMKKYAGATSKKGKTHKLDSIQITNYGLDNGFNLEEYPS